MLSTFPRALSKILYSKTYFYREELVCFRRHSSYVERRVEVVTGRHLFPKHDKDKGFKFQVTYVDEKPTGPGDGRSNPVVLLLHGTPGCYKNFDSQIEFLKGKGARVVAPNFPELSEFRTCRPIFRNSPINRAAYLTDFLHTIGINRVNVLVAHSAAFFAALKMFNDQEKLPIKAMALLNPTGLQTSTANPFWVFRLLGELVYWKPGYAFYEMCGMWLLPKIVSVPVPNIDEVLVSITAVRSHTVKEVIRDLKLLRTRKPPLLFVFSGNDWIIPKSSPLEVLSVLGSTEEDYWLYDQNGQLAKKGNAENWIQTMYFEKGSHSTFKKFSDVINWSLLGILRKTIASDEQELNLNERLLTKPVLQN